MNPRSNIPVFLFAFANDSKGRLVLGKEQDACTKALTTLTDNGRIKIQLLAAATLESVYDKLNQYGKDIHLFHYGGHSNSREMLFHGTAGSAKNLGKKIGEQQNIQLVFLNGCQNKNQVTQLFEAGVPVIIATNIDVEDEQSVLFAEQFYKALAAGNSLKQSFDSAKYYLSDKMSNTVSSYRGIGRPKEEDQFPWEIHAQDSASLNWTIDKVSSGTPITLPLVPSYQLVRESIRKNIKNLLWDPVANTTVFIKAKDKEGKIYKNLDTHLVNKFKRKGEIFNVLIKGEGGSGKTFLLHKLALGLLKNTDKVPIFLDLKKLFLCSSGSPKDDSFLVSFCRDEFKQQFSSSHHASLPRTFNELKEHGRLVLIFDSFDETPWLQGEKRESSLIQQFSKAIRIFSTGNSCIIASRNGQGPIYPTEKEFQSDIVLELLPLESDEIYDILKASGVASKATIRTIHNDRNWDTNLVNPLILTLFLVFHKEKESPPRSLGEMYDYFLFERFQHIPRLNTLLAKHSLSPDAFREISTKIAVFLETEEDVSINGDTVPRDWLNACKVHRQSKTGRLYNSTFLFSHRKFHEFYFAQSLKDDEQIATRLKGIKKNAPLDQLLLMYAQTAPLDESKNIATYCWKKIKDIDQYTIEDRRYANSVRYLRFLTATYRGRKEGISDFESDLVKLIKRLLESSNILKVKHAAETIPLFSEGTEIASIALSRDNMLVNETILKNLPFISLNRTFRNRLLRYYLSKHSDGGILKVKPFERSVLSISTAKFFRFTEWRISMFLTISLLIAMFLIPKIPFLESNLEIRLFILPFLFYLPFFNLVLCNGSFLTQLLMTGSARSNNLYKEKVFYIPLLSSILFLPAKIDAYLGYQYNWPFLLSAITGIAIGLIIRKRKRKNRKDQELLGKINQFLSMKLKDPKFKTYFSKIFSKIQSQYQRIELIKDINAKKIRFSKGNWPENKFPGAFDDDASSLLAAMQEDWLGLRIDDNLNADKLRSGPIYWHLKF